MTARSIFFVKKFKGGIEMGYTHYYDFKGTFTDAHIEDVKRVLERYPFLVYEYDSPDKKPVITESYIAFNGSGDEGHEDFYIESSFKNYCKTNRKPYDLPVCEVLLVLKHHYGKDFILSSDGFWVSKDDFYKNQLDENWNEALQQVKDIFGYEFELKKTIHDDGRGHLYYEIRIV